MSDLAKVIHAIDSLPIRGFGFVTYDDAANGIPDVQGNLTDLVAFCRAIEQGRIKNVRMAEQQPDDPPAATPIKLRRDKPINSLENFMNWRCDIWEEDALTLFASAWGHTFADARLKADSIIRAMGRE
jgi:hypothetical protein